MKVPNFGKYKKMRNLQDGEGKKVNPLSEIDPSLIVNVEFGLKNRDNIPQYTLEITKWDEKDFKIQMDFSDPSSVSRGKTRDTVELKFKNPYFFVS
jgi:hypothetical protein